MTKTPAVTHIFYFCCIFKISWSNQFSSVVFLQYPLQSQGGWSPILLLFSVRLLLNHDKNTSSIPHFLLLLYIQNILVKSIQFGWCFYSIPYNEIMWVTAGVFVMI